MNLSVYTPSDTPGTHPDTQKHAQTTVLEAYLWFKKNLAKKIALEKKLEQFRKICHICTLLIMKSRICIRCYVHALLRVHVSQIVLKYRDILQCLF